MKREGFTRNVVFVLFTIVLVLGLALFVSNTVFSQNEEGMFADEAGLRVMEQEYVQEIRTYLNEQGYENSGVTLTWVSEADGSRSYEVVLYHKGMHQLSEAEKAELFAGVKALAFEAAGCNFQVNLLV